MKSRSIVATTSVLNLGGSTTFLLYLADAMHSLGHELKIVCFSENNGMEADFSQAGISVECLKGQHRIFEDRILEGYQAVVRHRPSAVLACLGSQCFEVLRMLPPGVVRVGLVQSHDPSPYAVVEGYRSSLDMMVGVSTTITNQLRSMGFPNVVCIPYGIRFLEPVERFPASIGQPLRLMYLGRLVEFHKKVSRIVALVRLLVDRGVNFTFRIVGEGPDKNSVRKSLASYSQVTFLPAVPNAEVTSLLRDTDVIVLLSDFEGLPLSLLEAMGEGVVPLVSDLESGVREIIDENTGFRVPLGDVAAAADAVELLAKNLPRLDQLSRNAEQMARREYSARRMAERFLEMLESFPATSVDWPDRAEVPRPEFVKPGWMFEGLPRKVRRGLKNLRNAIV